MTIFVTSDSGLGRGAKKEVKYTYHIATGGEVQCRIMEEVPPTATFYLNCDITSSYELMLMLMLTDALRRLSSGDIHLCITYLPYARQDRVCNPGEAHSLRVISDIINAQNYKSVTVWDVHSDVALGTLNRVRNIKPWVFLDPVLQKAAEDKTTPTVLVAPDAGALKKVHELAMRYKLKYVRADRSRDPETGSLSDAIVYSEHVGNATFLIVDDICDGGRTFLQLAEALRLLTDGELQLYITHGLFSNGTDELSKTFSKVYTANNLSGKALPDNFITL